MSDTSTQTKINNLLLSRHYHERIFRIYGLSVASLYFFRFVMSLIDGLVLEPLLFFALASTALVFAYLPFIRQRFGIFTFALNALLMFAEVLLVYRGYSDFVRYFLMFPVTIVYVCILSGMLYGTLATVLGCGLGFWVFRFPETLTFFDRLPAIYDRFQLEFWILITLSQIFVAAFSFLFSDLTGKSESERRDTKIEAAKIERKIHMAVEIGKIAHEVNNPLAILDGGLRMLTIYEKNGDWRGQKRCLEQMKESSFRLQQLARQSLVAYETESGVKSPE